MAGLRRALVVNTGSSSLKWARVTADGVVEVEGNERWSGDDHQEQIRATIAKAGDFDAIGHRVVHGGTKFRASVLVDAGVRKELAELVALDPLHMRPAVAAIEAAAAARPTLPQVAAFDTAFHSTMTPAAAGYGVPFEWEEKYGARRYGFHGLAVDWAVGRAEALLGGLPSRMVVCHLGSGCSVTAVHAGRSVDTSMGFSPLEGLVMGTRAGSVDPGLLLHLQTARGFTPERLARALANESGLLGVSGVSNDLRQVLSAIDGGHARAKLAYDRFAISLVRAVGGAAAVLGGLDALVFSGGIGENSPKVRRDLAVSLAFTGLALDPAANEAVGRADVAISRPDSGVRALVVHAREEQVVLRELKKLVR